MEANQDRSWMYNLLTDGRQLDQAFLAGLKEFIKFALAHSNNSSRTIRCPCAKCRCLRFKDPGKVKIHLCQNGFMEDYEC